MLFNGVTVVSMFSRTQLSCNVNEAKVVRVKPSVPRQSFALMV